MSTLPKRPSTQRVPGGMTVEEVRQLSGDQLIDWMFAQRWYARPNDLIGGWSVMPVDGRVSDGWPEVADFVTEDLAEYIADLHNKRLTGESS